VGNGVWLPVVVIFILLLVNRRDLMGEYVNTVTFNVVAWVTGHRHDRSDPGANLHGNFPAECPGALMPKTAPRRCAAAAAYVNFAA